MITTFAGRDRAFGDGGRATEAWLYEPSGIAVDSAGNLYIADTENHRVRKVTPGGLITTVAGTTSWGFAGDGGPGTAARLNGPSGIATDRAGNIYIADKSNCRVRKVTAAGVITTVAGSGNSCYFSGDGGPATAASLSLPGGIAVDAAGNLFIADTEAHRIRKVNLAGMIMTVAGSGDAISGKGFSGDGGPATAAQLNSPAAVAVDGAGDLYIADTWNSRVRKVTATGVISTVAGNGAPGYTGDGGLATAARLYHPTGVAVDAAGTVYVADSGAIRKVTLDGTITTLPAGLSVYSNPAGVALDGAGNVYVTDSAFNRVQRVAPGGGVSTVTGAAYTYQGWIPQNLVGQIGNGGPGASGHLYWPGGIAVDGRGNAYISDTENDIIRKITPDGIITTAAGRLLDWGDFGRGDGGPATEATLWLPWGIAADAAGNLYIADYGNDRIRKLSPEGIITTVAGIQGYFSWGFSGDGGLGTAAYLYGPMGVALDAAGDLYIADSHNRRVRKVDPAGIISTVAGSGDTWVSGGHSPDGGPATATALSSPVAVATDHAGNLYIADRDQHCIRKVAPTGIITTAAGKDHTFAIERDGDGGPATEAILRFPTGVAVDSGGNLFIAEASSNRIRKVDSAGIITTMSGPGPANMGFFGDGGPAAAAELANPQGVAVDAAGKVYIADTDNNRIRVLLPTSASCAYSVDPPGLTVSVAGGSLAATVRTDPSCPWAFTDLPDWVTISGHRFGVGPAAVTLVVAPNPFGPRTAQISVGGITIPVTQLDTGSLAGTPSINPRGIANAANLAPAGQVPPGSIAAVAGAFPVNSSSSAVALPLPTSLSGLSLQFEGGVHAPLWYASSDRVIFQVPWEIAGGWKASLTAMVDGQPSAVEMLELDYSPGIFSMNGQGTGQGAILDESYRLVDSSNPATAGSTFIQIFCTGLGAVTNQPPSGSAAPYNPLAVTTMTPTVTIGGKEATVSFSGLTPGSVGLYQVNAQVPAAAPKGAAVPVVITMNGWRSNTVTTAVK